MWQLLKPFLQLTLSDIQYQQFRRLILVCLAYLGYSNSLRRMDKKIVELFLGKRNGFFIEVGAADGVDQSNTVLLEKKFNWTGLLVEPINEQFNFCKKVRKNSFVENCCLTSFENSSKESEIYSSNLTSRIVGKNDLDENNKIEIVENNNLDNLLKKYHIKNVDIMSLDVEGYEIEVLNGYTDDKKVIEYLLVETWDFKKFSSYARNRKWQYICSWSDSDFLYKLR